MDAFGSKYEGQRNEFGKFHGNGKFTFPNGNYYIGQFKNGEFDGRGILHFTGGMFKATWKGGQAMQGEYIFNDGLKYGELAPQTKDAEDWKYCTGEDLRFYTERIHGTQPAGNSNFSNQVPPYVLPSNCYDVVEGYYDPDDNAIYSYEGVFLRTPEPPEIKWIKERCRIGKA